MGTTINRIVNLIGQFALISKGGLMEVGLNSAEYIKKGH